MKNQEIAELFSKIADALSLQDKNKFKIRAYRRAARAIKDLPEDIEKIYKEESLTDIPGVGKGIANKIKEYLETGKMTKYQKVIEEVPESLLSLLNIRELGPSTLRLLYKELGVENLNDLKKVIEDGSFSKLEGLGEKTAEKVKKNIGDYEESLGGEKRFLTGEVMVTVEEITEKLRQIESVEKVNTAGSYRRMKETVGDLDILVQSSSNRQVLNRVSEFPEVNQVLESGETKASVVLEGLSIRTDIRVVPEKSYGAALVYFTGSKEHNVSLRKIAQKKNLKLNEYGVFRDDEMISGKTEEEVYESLGLKYIPPEMREDRGEIEKSMEDDLPTLVSISDIRGNLHTHTDYSDGENSIREIVDKALEFKYEYIGITDHSKSASYAGGLSVDELKKQIDEIDELREEFKDIEILKGIESDIGAGGELDYSEEILEELDFVVGAIHSGFKKNVTERMKTALENPHLKILAHPTGRLLSGRDGYDFNLEEVMQKAKEEDKVLEINAYYDRLDLNDIHSKEAYEMGNKMVINTDAHTLRMFDWMTLGVGVARRAWLPPEAIVNTYDYEKLSKALKING